MPKTQKKLFVLDTNVILHDYNCINSFENNDIVIPITVLEEIDGFKHGKDQIHFNAREFIRILDGLSGDKLVNGGVSLGKGKGKIQILTNHQQEPEVLLVGVPARTPRLDDADSKRRRMYLLSHTLSLSCQASLERTRLMWLVRFLMRTARPIALGRIL